MKSDTIDKIANIFAVMFAFGIGIAWLLFTSWLFGVDLVTAFWLLIWRG